MFRRLFRLLRRSGSATRSGLFRRFRLPRLPLLLRPFRPLPVPPAPACSGGLVRRASRPSGLRLPDILAQIPPRFSADGFSLPFTCDNITADGFSCAFLRKDAPVFDIISCDFCDFLRCADACADAYLPKTACEKRTGRDRRGRPRHGIKRGIKAWDQNAGSKTKAPGRRSTACEKRLTKSGCGIGGKGKSDRKPQPDKKARLCNCSTVQSCKHTKNYRHSRHSRS